MKTRLLMVCWSVTVLSLVVATAGCQPPPSGNIDEVKVGMSFADVIRIMGGTTGDVVKSGPSGRLGEVWWNYPQGRVLVKYTNYSFWSGSCESVVEKVENYALMANVEINSEPRGARIYEKGRYKGIAPLIMHYGISDTTRQTGVLDLPPLVAVADGCLPSQVQLRLELETEQRNDFGHLFALERDPNYRPPTIIVQQGASETNVNVQTQRDKDVLDVLEQAGRLRIMYKTLKAMER